MTRHFICWLKIEMGSKRSLTGISVVIPAAGTGIRMGSSIPKQYLTCGHRTVLEITLDRFLSLQPDQIVLVVSPTDDYFQDIPGVASCRVVKGGVERSDSVLAGLRELKLQQDDWVMVHDAVRPCVRTADILRLVATVARSRVGGLLAIPVTDTLKASRTVSCSSQVSHTINRQGLWQAQTPQLFRFGVLNEALQQVEGMQITDESAAVENAGMHPRLVEGHRDNIKITEPEDIELARIFLSASGSGV